VIDLVILAVTLAVMAGLVVGWHTRGRWERSQVQPEPPRVISLVEYRTVSQGRPRFIQ
jgi:uncharacterized protein YneF (UPF0154 family)